LFVKTKYFYIDIPGIRLAACQWGENGKPTIIALHGWLDNLASFSKIATGLKDYRVIAIDFPGHGHSQHRTQDVAYHMFDYVSDIIEATKVLKLQKFHIMGHSMGGIITSLIAGCFPKQILSVIFIEGILPLHANNTENCQLQLKKYLKMKSLFGNKKTIYKTKKTAIKKRMSGLMPLGIEAASILVERGLTQCEGGWCWRTDKRLMLPSMTKLTTTQCEYFISNLDMPVLLILAENGIYLDAHEDFHTRWANFKIKILPGGHHLHLDDSVSDVINTINDFLTNY